MSKAPDNGFSALNRGSWYHFETTLSFKQRVSPSQCIGLSMDVFLHLNIMHFCADNVKLSENRERPSSIITMDFRDLLITFIPWCSRTSYETAISYKLGACPCTRSSSFFKTILARFKNSATSTRQGRPEHSIKSLTICTVCYQHKGMLNRTELKRNGIEFNL